MRITYLSFGQNPFNTWRIFLISIPLLMIVLKICTCSTFVILLGSVILAGLIGLLITLFSFSYIIKEKNQIVFKDGLKSERLYDLVKIETWWQYEYGLSTEDITVVGKYKEKNHSNIIHLYAKLISNNKSVIIKEEIEISEKFPNNHEYDFERKEEGISVFKVWDVDRCIHKLQLSEYLKKS